ncbi:hypothetical protein J4464_00980 [Candidatus Woesearchaeota archaeon]|nr:hypothetical protein [Candidatus Woesearchaeota archaeon]
MDEQQKHWTIALATATIYFFTVVFISIIFEGLLNILDAIIGAGVFLIIYYLLNQAVMPISVKKLERKILRKRKFKARK